MVCDKCKDQGFTVKVEKSKSGKTLVTHHIICQCEIGQKLDKLWKEYPVWLGAPYSFFQLSLNVKG